jgi:hypothetical protein
MCGKVRAMGVGIKTRESSPINGAILSGICCQSCGIRAVHKSPLQANLSLMFPSAPRIPGKPKMVPAK